eukprot:CAMPEP_0178438244 /NCGR_PEP_ID=MMETSP0689_2-20121128/35484_1 /TAXON_ID=160604 /ORGANISM="Amphidinium massartii, Strain CS-259" /LENGTH=173 /DNA_ID=CAMNT_0020060623 /DNA_START=641 /DNA_END=1163 /DNA_ORIENTATION=+
MYPSVQAAMAPTEPFIKMYCLLFGEALASFLGLLLSFFYLFHIYLMSRAMTTIEFCEKSVKRIGSDSSTYDMGLYRNAKAVLGENILLWFLPCSPPAGDGLSYLTEDTPLLKASAQDVEGGVGDTEHGRGGERVHRLALDQLRIPGRRIPEAVVQTPLVRGLWMVDDWVVTVL